MGRKKNTERTIDSLWFRTVMRQKGYGVRSLGRVLGVSPTSVSRILSGKHGMSMGVAIQLSKTFGVPVDTIMQRAGFQVSGETSSVSGVVRGQVNAVGDETGSREARFPLPPPQELVALEVEDVASPQYAWKYCYSETASTPIQDCLGRWCVLEDRGGRKHVVHVRRLTDTGEAVVEKLDGSPGVCGFRNLWNVIMIKT